MFWRDAAQYTGSLVPFIQDGLQAGEPVMAAVTRQHAGWLKDALDGQAGQVEFVDIAEIGRNPARLIPAWRRFVDSRSFQRGPVRGIGEPIWPGRRPEELLESQLHEALLNVAVDPETPFWLVCPYDTENLDAAVIDDAHRSHPAIVGDGSYQGSAHYAGRAHADLLFAAGLPAPAGASITTAFTAHNAGRLATYLRLELRVAGLPDDQAARLADAIQRVALSSLRRGATEGTVRIWNRRDAVICEVTDRTTVEDVLLGRRVPPDDGPDGLWHAHQVCDLVQARSSATGTCVRIHTWR